MLAPVQMILLVLPQNPFTLKNLVALFSPIIAPLMLHSKSKHLKRAFGVVCPVSHTFYSEGKKFTFTLFGPNVHKDSRRPRISQLSVSKYFFFLLFNRHLKKHNYCKITKLLQFCSNVVMLQKLCQGPRVQCLPGCVTVTGKVGDPDREPSAGNSFPNISLMLGSFVLKYCNQY